MKIIVDPASFTQSRNGIVCGAIWIEMAGMAFPEKNWSDLVLAVLRGWSADMEQFIARDPEQERLYFMDGPFEIDVLRTSGHILQLSLVDRRNGQSSGACEMTQTHFWNAIVDAAQVAIDACWKNDFDSRDLVHLQRLSKMLE